MHSVHVVLSLGFGPAGDQTDIGEAERARLCERAQAAAIAIRSFARAAVVRLPGMRAGAVTVGTNPATVSMDIGLDEVAASWAADQAPSIEAELLTACGADRAKVQVRLPMHGAFPMHRVD